MILVPQHGFPIVNLMLWFRVGAPFDPPGKAGLTALTLRMLMRGTQRRGRAELEEAIEALGTEVHTHLSGQSACVGGAVLSRSLEPFVALLGELMTVPALAEAEVEKVKREMAAELEAMRDDDAALASRWFRHLTFEGHAFGAPAGGTRASLEAIGVEDVRAHYHRYFNRANLLVAASGDVDRARLVELLDRALAPLPEGTASEWSFASVPAPRGRRVVLIDKADRSQAQIYLGHPAIPASDPDLLALQIATTAFGGMFTARLMEEVRVKRGWSYGAYARLGAERSGGTYVLTAAPSVEYASETLSLLMAEYARFVGEGLSDDEVRFAKGYLRNAFAFSLETHAQQAGLRVRGRLLGLPDDHVDTYLARLKATSPEQVRAAVRRHLHPDDLLAVVVCTAPALRDAMAALPGVVSVQVRPYNDPW